MSSVMAEGKRIGHVIPCHLSYFCVAALMSNGGEACGYLNPTFPPPLLLSPIFLFHRHLTMSSLGLKGIGLLLLLVFLVMCSNFHECEGRRGKHRRAKQAPSSSLARKKAKGNNGGDRRHGSGGGSGGQPRPTPETMAAMFNVLDFGAKGDGMTDDTKAFEAAWAAACKVEASTVIVPAEFEFLVRPISFSGPYCEPNIVFQLDGTIVAPTSAGAWGAGSLQWLEFTKLQEITIRGSGVIDGRGSVWWTNSDSDIDPINGELGSKMPQIKPTALRFYGSYNVTVTGIRIQYSPRCHLKFDNCEAVEVFNITVSSPGDSPNTDGIHLQNSRNVWIHRVDMGCGDDCVSIQTGCSNIYIHDVDCGPGHGISIGGLGRDNTKACVSNITVRDINLRNTMTGVRIKTWQGGSGSVQAIQFSNIKVWEVQIPMVIDQFYCDRSSCENQSSAVALSSIAYESIRGTFTVKPVHLACSDSSPCSGISLSEVELEPLQERYHMTDPFCWQAFGELYAPTIPPITCLQIGKPASNRISTDHDLC